MVYLNASETVLIASSYYANETVYAYDDFTVTDEELSEAEEEWNYSCSIYVIAAICGNFWEESTLNPAIYESLEKLTTAQLTDDSVYGGYGLGQWTNDANNYLTRRTKLIEWLNKNNYSITNGAAQMLYLVEENVWYTEGYGAYFSTLSDFLSSDSTNLELLTYAFMNGWEGNYTEEQYEKRYTAAQLCYDYILEHYDDESIYKWYYGNYYLSEEQRLNNAVMLFRILSSGETPIVKHTKSKFSSSMAFCVLKPNYKLYRGTVYTYNKLAPNHKLYKR